MVRSLDKITQTLAPTDGSLKSFVRDLLQKEVISSAVISIGGLGTRKIDGIIHPQEPNEEDDALIEASSRGWDKVNAEIESAFASTTALGLSIKKIEFSDDGGSFCEFERCRTTPIVVMANNRGSVQYERVPDVSVAEFLYHREGADLGPFNEVLNSSLRPAPELSGAQAGPIGVDNVLSRIADVSASLMDDLGKAQLRQADRMDELLENQAKDFEEQQAKLEETHQERLSELAQRSATLDQREEELDNATARSTRRGLRKDITADIKTNLKREIIPDSAQRLRWPIYGITVVGLVGSLVFSYFAFAQVADLPENLKGTPLNWYVASLLVRGSLGILAATAIGLYVVKYLRSLETEAGRRALALEQNLFDIDRASWVIETVMELKEEEGMSSVPSPWLEGATRGLFNRDGAETEERGPVDALVNLMGTGMSMKVAEGKVEASFDSKAARNAAKKQKQSEEDDS